MLASVVPACVQTSQPSWAAWIEISKVFFNSSTASSQPSWAAWIEMLSKIRNYEEALSRSPLGLRGLKFWYSHVSYYFNGRSPLGLRGLKYYFYYAVCVHC